MIQDELDRCGDSRPTLALLQAYALITFYETMTNARGRAWRSLGTCVRIAQEMELHLTDAVLQGKSLAEQALTQDGSWSQKEEKRRAWWLLYDLDIFASTVRRRPTSIHDGDHAVLLPVSDTNWFEASYQGSCFLDPDPLHRTRKLIESGNSNGKAWYLVVKSLNHDAYTTANPTAHHLHTIPQTDIASPPKMVYAAPVDERKLAVLDDFMLHFKAVLPRHLVYEGDYLPFSICGDSYSEATAPQDCDIQLIHAMYHLGRLKVLHHFCCKSSADRSPRGEHRTEYLALNQISRVQKLRRILGFTDDESAWDRYLGAAEEIIRVVRNTSPDHVRHGHPLLASTFWIVAATQLFRRTFAKNVAELEVAQSNYDFLRLTLDRSHKFWTTSDLMVKNLDTLDARLNELTSKWKGPQLNVRNGSTRIEEGENPPEHNCPAILNSVPHSFENPDAMADTSSESFDSHPSLSNIGNDPRLAYQMPSQTSGDIGIPDGGELHEFMYDFCGDRWDFWDQELADIFPTL